MSKSKKTKVIRDIQTPNGLLAKGSKVKVREVIGDEYRISDMTGRIFWVQNTDLAL